MDHSEKQMADDLTNEPVVFMGCTGTEISTVAIVCFCSSLLAGIVVGIMLIGVSSSLALIAGTVITMGGSVGVSVFVLRKLQLIKEERGDSYHLEVIQLALSDWGLIGKIYNSSKRFGRGRKL